MGKSWGGRERRRRKKGYYPKRDDFRPHRGGIEKKTSAAKPLTAETRDYIKDPSAPTEASCTICEKNEIAAWLRLESSDPEIQTLLDYYEDKSLLIQKFSNRSEWKNPDYGHYCGQADDLRTAIVNFAKSHLDSEKLKATAKTIREEFRKNSDQKKFISQPQFYLQETKKGLERRGQFVTLNFSKTRRFFDLPLLLGLETDKYHTLYACQKCLYELQTSLLETGKKSGIHPKSKKELVNYFLRSEQALAYEDALKRPQEIQTKKEAKKEQKWESAKRPTAAVAIINPEEENGVSHSFFPIVFNVFDRELDQKISKKRLSPSEILNLAMENLGKLTPKEVGKVEILLGQKIDHGGMPGHLGFPGGSDDPGEEPSKSNLNLRSHLPPGLLELSEKNPAAEQLFRRTLEELVDRTGFLPRKVYGRIIRLPKNPQHVDQCLLISAETNPSQPIRKIQKMYVNQTKFWFTLDEMYSDQIGYVAHNHKRILLAIFELHQLPMPKGMEEFRETLKAKQIVKAP